MNQENNPPALMSMRLSLALVSLVAVALELTLMRGLALRFWSPFAAMVIGVALLGFGAAGSVLALISAFVRRYQRTCLTALALLLTLSIPATWWASQRVPLDIGFLAWQLPQTDSLLSMAWPLLQNKSVLAIELLMFVPFLLAGAFVGIALMDLPERISGHYAANLFGSGAGGIVAVLAMNFLTTVELLVAITGVGFLAAAFVICWKNWRGPMAAVVVLAATGAVIAKMPWEPGIFPRKSLPLARSFEGSKEIYQTEGPLGRIDVLTNPAFHDVMGLSLQYLESPPPVTELIVDADAVSPIYDCKKLADWEVLDYRTAAAPYHVGRNAVGIGGGFPRRVCVVDAGGGGEIGLALFHDCPDITALEPNPQIIRAMTGPLASRGGDIYLAAGVHVINQEPRGFFAALRAGDTFNVIQVPPMGSLGSSGLYAAQESYLYTIESIRSMFDHLSEDGVICLTRGFSPPPREELRAFDLAAQTLRQQGLDPADHLAMIRAQFTTSVLLFKQPLKEAQTAAIRDFCKSRGFDLCYLPGLKESENEVINSFNEVAEPNYYFLGPRALLGPQRASFLASYPFDIAAPTDDKPYFFHGFRWSSLAKMQKDLGAGSHAFLEMGHLMLVVALEQTIALGAVLMLLPLAPGIKGLRQAPGKAASLGYFLMLGLAFMLLEMGFVQKLILYLAHPIYAAAVVIAGFLVFAGLGSLLSKSWRRPAHAVISWAVAAIILLAVAYLFGLDAWLGLTQSWPVTARCFVAALTIAPLAFAMGHLFPMGLERVAQTHPALVPWGWAVNGFASVAATAAAPLMAMRFGFSRLVLLALACYLLAALLFRLIPAPVNSKPLVKSQAQPTLT